MKAIVLALLFIVVSFASLPYWVEHGYDGSSIGPWIWVKANITSPKTYLLVYFGGNSSNSSLSNGSSVFEVFDDFEGSSFSSEWAFGPSSSCNNYVSSGRGFFSSDGDWWRNSDTACGGFLEVNASEFIFESLLRSSSPPPSYVRVAMVRENPTDPSARFFGTLFDGDASHITTLWRDSYGGPASWSGEESGKSLQNNTSWMYLKLEQGSSNSSWFFSQDGKNYSLLKQKNATYGNWVGISPSLTPSYLVEVEWVRVRKPLPDLNITYGNVESGSWDVNGTTYNKRVLIEVSSTENYTGLQLPLNYSYINDTNIEIFEGNSSPPSVELSSPKNGSVVYSSLEFELNVTDADSSSLACSIYVDGDLVYSFNSSPGTAKKEYSPEDGIHIWKAKCSDGITEVESKEWVFVKVTQPKSSSGGSRSYSSDIRELREEIDSIKSLMYSINNSLESLKEEFYSLNENQKQINRSLEEERERRGNLEKDLSYLGGAFKNLTLTLVELEQALDSMDLEGNQNEGTLKTFEGVEEVSVESKASQAKVLSQQDEKKSASGFLPGLKRFAIPLAISLMGLILILLTLYPRKNPSPNRDNKYRFKGRR